MKLCLWRAMQGIKDEQLLVSVLLRVVAKELILTSFSFWVFYDTHFKWSNVVICFDSQMIYMKIQEVMITQLGWLTWDQVTEGYPLTSSYKALSEYFIAFKDSVVASILFCIVELLYISFVWWVLRKQAFCFIRYVTMWRINCKELSCSLLLSLSGLVSVV